MSESEKAESGAEKPREFKRFTLMFWFWLYALFVISSDALGSILAISALSQEGVQVQFESYVHTVAMAGASIAWFVWGTHKDVRHLMRSVRYINI